MAVFEGRTEVITRGAGLPGPPRAPAGERRDPYVLRALSGPEETALADAVLADAFGIEGLVDGPPEHLVFEPSRNHVAEHRGEIVANLAALTRRMTVPGAVLPAAHITRGGVRQTHRRRGLMTRLLGGQLRESRDVHGEFLAVLWASEGRIYQRYGFGMASQNQTFLIDNREVRLNRPPDGSAGQLREAAPARVGRELRAVYERVHPSRPGWSSRDDNVWHQLLEDPPPPFRQGYSAKRALVFDGPDGPEGYAIWKRRQEWDGGVAKGEASVVEVVAATPVSYAALWHFLLSVDLTRTVRCDFAAVDEPLLLLVNEPRDLGVSVSDGLWVRLLDLPGALSARRYAVPLDVVIQVTDAMLPENAGRWRLTVRDGEAACVATADDPDLSGDVADLGAAYLGGVSLGALGAAGRVREHRPGALATASAAFGWHVGPSALDIF
ncbi:GNAT family N-acetyltransferase [Streptosporangium sp. NPDC051022]|uniref:GNAT family N-acetyltransferase n=1 Tax=Streptosporangium sp. NPDC051022 TaxID=3155752 RepID=UPI00342EF1FE